jgi:anti-anti-sigma factor
MQPGGLERQGPHESVAGTVLNKIVEELLRKGALMAGEADFAESPVAVREAKRSEAVPTFLAAVHGYEFAAGSVAGTRSRRSGGGDWSEAVELPGGRLAVAIGDLVGGGESSSTAITLLRGALVSALLAGDDVTAVLHRLDALATRIPAAVGSTVAIVVFDPANEELSCGSAGHPWPMFVSQSRPASFLTGSCGMPLATVGEPVASQTVPLAAGDALVLYTDGVMSGRGWGPGDADAAFLDVASDLRSGHFTCAELSDRLLGVMLPAGEPVHDDAVLLVVRAGSVDIPPFLLDVPAVPEQLAVVRRALNAWMTSANIGAQDAMDVQLAVGEAMANAVEHAYRDQEPGRAMVTAVVHGGGKLSIEVSDNGSWRETDVVASAHRGRGLHLVRASMGDVQLERGPGGTTVRMNYQLSYEAAPAKPAAANWAGTDALEIEILTGGRPICVRMTGELDAANAGEVRDKVQQISRGGSVPLRLDLAGVEYLDSFAVRTLFELAMAAQASGERLTVTVQGGGPIERVLLASGLGQLAGIERASRPE